MLNSREPASRAVTRPPASSFSRLEVSVSASSMAQQYKFFVAGQHRIKTGNEMPATQEGFDIARCRYSSARPRILIVGNVWFHCAGIVS